MPPVRRIMGAVDLTTVFAASLTGALLAWVLALAVTVGGEPS